jgi:hypothetical protein
MRAPAAHAATCRYKLARGAGKLRRARRVDVQDDAAICDVACAEQPNETSFFPQGATMTVLKSIAVAVSMLVAGSVLAQPATPGINDRQANQEARIEQGVTSGQLTRREAARLRAEQRAIRAEKRMARADGVVTPAERARIRRDQRRASRDIYRQKHDAQIR